MATSLADLEERTAFVSTESRVSKAWSPGVEIIATIIYFVFAIFSATHHKLWFDEVNTALLSKLRFPQLWNALASGADTNPPLLYLPVHLLNRVTSNIELACRLPSILEFYLMMAATYCIARKYVSPIYSLISSFVPFLTIAGSFATEGRGYAATFGFSALALLCWRNATTHSRRALLLFGTSASIAAAIGNHYSATLILTALAGGEAVRAWRRRQIDWPVAASIVGGGIPLIVFYPLMGAVHRYLLSYWAKPSIHEMLSALSGWRWAALLVVILLTIHLLRNRIGAGREFLVPIHEITAWVILLLSPVQGYLQGLATGGFTMRYALPMVIPVSLFIALYAFHVFQGSTLPGLLLLTILAAVCAEKLMIVTFRPIIGGPEADWIENSQVGNEGPVVIGNPVVFSTLYFYAKEPLRSRLVYVSSPLLSTKYLHMNSPDLNLSELAQFSSLPAIDYESFMADRHPFTLVNDGNSWLLNKLMDEKTSIRKLTCQETWCVYAVGPNR